MLSCRNRNTCWWLVKGHVMTLDTAFTFSLVFASLISTSSWISLFPMVRYPYICVTPYLYNLLCFLLFQWLLVHRLKTFFFFLTTCPKSSAWDQEIKPWSLLCAFTAKKALQLRFTSERFVINLFCTSVKYLLHHSLDTWIHSCTWGRVSCVVLNSG